MPHEKPLIWTDTNISPAIAKWLNERFNVNALSFYKLNFQTASDYTIFMKAKEENAIFITKDKDYKSLISTFKSPPYIILIKGGNLSNSELKKMLDRSFQRCLDLILNHNHQITELE